MPRPITSAQRDELTAEASAFLFSPIGETSTRHQQKRTDLRRMLNQLRISRVTDTTTAYQYHCLMALFTKDA